MIVSSLRTLDKHDYHPWEVMGKKIFLQESTELRLMKVRRRQISSQTWPANNGKGYFKGWDVTYPDLVLHGDRNRTWGARFFPVPQDYAFTSWSLIPGAVNLWTAKMLVSCPLSSTPSSHLSHFSLQLQTPTRPTLRTSSMNSSMRTYHTFSGWIHLTVGIWNMALHFSRLQNGQEDLLNTDGWLHPQSFQFDSSVAGPENVHF